MGAAKALPRTRASHVLRVRSNGSAAALAAVTSIALVGAAALGFSQNASGSVRRRARTGSTVLVSCARSSCRTPRPSRTLGAGSLTGGAGAGSVRRLRRPRWARDRRRGPRAAARVPAVHARSTSSGSNGSNGSGSASKPTHTSSSRPTHTSTGRPTSRPTHSRPPKPVPVVAGVLGEVHDQAGGRRDQGRQPDGHARADGRRGPRPATCASRSSRSPPTSTRP